MRRNAGFSLIELLVCVAIISILMSMYLGTLSKARDRALQVVAAEGMHQQNIAAMANQANTPRGSKTTTRTSELVREQCRLAFREDVGDQIYVSRLMFIVTNDAEFRAYWHTLLNPNADWELEYDGGSLLAYDPEGNEYLLPSPETNPARFNSENRGPVLAWEFLSSHMADMNTGSLSVNVLMPSGNIERVRYPGAFPVTATVAELSHEFVRAYGT